MLTWKSLRISSSSDSNSASDLSISSIRSTQPGRLLQRLQQRTRLDEFLGEEHVAEIVQLAERVMQRLRAAQHFAELVLEDLGVEQLLGVFPLVKRLGLVEPLVALQADHLQAAPAGDRLGQLGLADAGRAFDQDRLCDLLGQVDGGRDLAARDIALRGKARVRRLRWRPGGRPRGRPRAVDQPRMSAPVCYFFRRNLPAIGHGPTGRIQGLR